MKKPELLLPAGDYERLQYALEYGADAVYIGGKEFSLRERASNFTLGEIEQAVKYTHNRGKKLYVTVNAFLNNTDFSKIKKYIKKLEVFGVDAVIVADPGLIHLIKKEAPSLKMHLSTQANTTNYMSAAFWKTQGIKRIVLARELNLKEIKEVVKKNKGLEFEMFIHGAMCISYSGRCFLSVYLTGRDANKGDCAHSCRWNYALLEEDKRKGEYMYYEEDKKGAYIFNTRDMCMIKHIPELIETGVKSFKIEGRVKTLYYVATVARAYRNAIDLYMKDTYNCRDGSVARLKTGTLRNSQSLFKKNIKKWVYEINILNSRGHTTGFYLGTPEKKDYKYEGELLKKHYFYAKVLKVIDSKTIKVLIKNKLCIGDTIDIITPNIVTSNKAKITNIILDNEQVSEAKSTQEVHILVSNKIEATIWSLIRKL